MAGEAKRLRVSNGTEHYIDILIAMNASRPGMIDALKSVGAHRNPALAPRFHAYEASQCNEAAKTKERIESLKQPKALAMTRKVNAITCGDCHKQFSWINNGRAPPADKCQAVSPCTDLGVDALSLVRVSELEAVALPLLEEALQSAPGGSKRRRAESLSRALGHNLERDFVRDYLTPVCKLASLEAKRISLHRRAGRAQELEVLLSKLPYSWPP